MHLVIPRPTLGYFGEFSLVRCYSFTQLLGHHETSNKVGSLTGRLQHLKLVKSFPLNVMMHLDTCEKRNITLVP